MKRRGCRSCHIIEPVAGQWRDGLCPSCTETAKNREAVAPPPRPQTPDPTVTRLQGYLAQIAREFPDCWKAFDQLRSLRGSQLERWPDWCFCPVSGAYAIASGGGPGELPFERLPAVASLAALGAWRPTQGIYRFDQTVLDAVWETPVTGDIPGDVLHGIPEWCVYVETPGRTAFSGTRPLLGFLAFLEQDTKDHREELRLVLDDGQHLIGTLPIHLGGGLDEGLRQAHAAAMREIRLRGERDGAELRNLLDEQGEQIIADIAPLVSTVLYLCAENAEIPGRTRRTWPRPKRTSRGDRLYPPDKARVWEVGYRLGAAIRHAQQEERRGSEGTGTHSSPRPHIRRAHWHSFWTGPKAKVGVARSEERKLILRWLPPIAVNVEEDASVVPTIHPVGR